MDVSRPVSDSSVNFDEVDGFGVGSRHEVENWLQVRVGEVPIDVNMAATARRERFQHGCKGGSDEFLTPGMTGMEGLGDDLDTAVTGEGQRQCGQLAIDPCAATQIVDAGQ